MRQRARSVGSIHLNGRVARGLTYDTPVTLRRRLHARLPRVACPEKVNDLRPEDGGYFASSTVPAAPALDFRGAFPTFAPRFSVRVPATRSHRVLPSACWLRAPNRKGVFMHRFSRFNLLLPLFVASSCSEGETPEPFASGEVTSSNGTNAAGTTTSASASSGGQIAGTTSTSNTTITNATSSGSHSSAASTGVGASATTSSSQTSTNPNTGAENTTSGIPTTQVNTSFTGGSSTTAFSGSSGGLSTGGGASSGSSATSGGNTSSPAIVLDCNAVMPTSGAQQHTGNGTGGQGNLAWEIWSNTGQGELTTYTVPAFSASWNEAGGYLGRMGFEWGGFNATPEPYTAHGTITAQFVANKSGSGGDVYSYVGMYGWSSDPCVEWYVIDDSFRPMPVNPGTTTKQGEKEIDGGMYTFYTRPTSGSGGTRCEGVSDWIQYYSIRNSARSCGEISLTEHFDAWDAAGMELGNLLEAKILVEVGGGTGRVDFPIANVMTSQ